MGKEEEYGWQCHILGLITYCPASPPGCGLTEAEAYYGWTARGELGR
jgi:hypothetical protein